MSGNLLKAARIYTYLQLYKTWVPFVEKELVNYAYIF